MSPDDPRSGTHPAGTRTAGPPVPAPRFDHLVHLTSFLGVWEHAELTAPRVEHGLCTDDNARALIVVCRHPTRDRTIDDLASTYLAFVLEARTPAGTFHNRRGGDGAWLDEVGSDDSQGRAWWALGVAARLGPVAGMRDAARGAFADAGAFSSVHLRANAFAVLGAAELLADHPDHDQARALLRRCVEPLADAAVSRVPWVEGRLTYDNARIPEALLAAGAALAEPPLVHMGLRLLTWLVAVETRGDHFSFVSHRGWAPGQARPGFDQQPVEAAAMADACDRAFLQTSNPVWRTRALRAAQWFVGHNDTGCELYVRDTGGTRDGLMRDGANENQGAESTLAGLSALQVAAALADAPVLVGH